VQLGSVRGETLWETPDFGTAPDRYEVEIVGGASRMTFDAAPPEPPEAAAEPAVARIAPGGRVEPLSPEEFPTLAPLAGHLAHPDPDARFEFGLRVLLDGVERALARR
jgi:Tetracyclin repressor-like, C-terminal domain